MFKILLLVYVIAMNINDDKSHNDEDQIVYRILTENCTDFTLYRCAYLQIFYSCPKLQELNLGSIFILLLLNDRILLQKN